MLVRKAVDDSFTKISEGALLNVPGLRPVRRELQESARSSFTMNSSRGAATTRAFWPIWRRRSSGWA